VQLLEFERTTNAFNFVFERNLTENEVVIVKMPPVSANKRGINDIGWASDGDVQLYGTLARNPKNEDVLWIPIQANEEINKVVSAIKIENKGTPCRIEIRAIFN
jgi:hypothetical protein